MGGWRGGKVGWGVSGGGSGGITGMEDKEGLWNRAECGLGALWECSQYRERDGEMGLELKNRAEAVLDTRKRIQAIKDAACIGKGLLGSSHNLGTK